MGQKLFTSGVPCSKDSVLRREVTGDGGGVFWEGREGLGKDGELADLTMPSLI